MLTPKKRRRARRRRRKGARHPRFKDSGGTRELLTGHGQTVLNQRLLTVRRQLALAIWRQDVTGGEGSDAEREELCCEILSLTREVNQLESFLELAESPELEPGKGIGPGTAVAVIDAASGEEAEYRLIGCGGDPDSTVVTVGSPAGQALLGRQIGSLVTLKLADGLRRVRVVATHPLGTSNAISERS